MAEEEEKEEQEGQEEEDEQEEIDYDELQELKEKAQRVEALEEELAKYSDKEFNFKKFRDSKKEEQNKMMEDFSEKEQAMIRELANTNKRLEEYESERVEEVKESFFNSIGADEDLQKRLEDAVKTSTQFLGPISKSSDVLDRYSRAYKLLRDESEHLDPIHKFTPRMTGGDGSSSRGSKFSDSPQGKASLNAWFGDKIFPKNK